MRPIINQLQERVDAIVSRSDAQVATLAFGIGALDDGLADKGLRVDALHEVSGGAPGWGDDVAATLFLAGIAARNSGQILWVVRRQDLFAPALYQAGLAPDRLIQAEARDDNELLAVMEDALRYRALSAVVGEVRRAGLTATRRLQLAAEGGSTLALLLRRHVRLDEDPLARPSAAATRWRIRPAPSAALPVAGIGRPRWHVTLVRQRGGDPFETIVEACDEKGRCAVAAELVDRPDFARRALARAAG